MRKFQYGCGVITQKFLWNYFLFKITLNPNKKVEFPSEKQKDMSDDGTWYFLHNLAHSCSMRDILEKLRAPFLTPLPNALHDPLQKLY